MTRDQKTYRLAYWIACFILAGTFLSAAYYKVNHLADFTETVRSYRLLPAFLTGFSAWMILWLELFCGIGLLAIPRLRGIALRVAMALLILFSGAITINLLRGAQIHCGCFSSAADADPMGWMDVIRNLILISLTGLALYGRKKAAD